MKATLEEMAPREGRATARSTASARVGRQVRHDGGTDHAGDRPRELELDRNVKGVVITGVDPSGAAASAGLREGDVIQQVNGKSVYDRRKRCGAR